MNFNSYIYNAYLKNIRFFLAINKLLFIKIFYLDGGGQKMG